MADDDQITDDDWAAAMQEQAAAEDPGGDMNDADVEAALREAAAGAEESRISAMRARAPAR